MFLIDGKYILLKVLNSKYYEISIYFEVNYNITIDILFWSTSTMIKDKECM